MIKLPVLTLRDAVVMPGVTVYFEVAREKTVSAVKAAIEEEQLIFAVAQREPSREDPGAEDLFEVGTIAQVKQMVNLPDKAVRVVLVGVKRAKLNYLETADGYLTAGLEEIEDEDVEINNLEEIAMVRGLKAMFSVYSAEFGKLNPQMVQAVMESTDLEEMVYEIASNIPVHYELKQKLLEETDLEKRQQELAVLLNREISIMRIQAGIMQQVKSQVDKNQKEYYLREQIKAIHKELGDEDALSEADEFKEALDQLDADSDVKEKIAAEIKRYRLVGMNSSEGAVIRSYIETLLALPWNIMSKDNTDILHAKEVLDEDHYGLTKVKERVLECLAVKTLKKDGSSPIMCLVGPPGTGKTSIARSIARAMERKYIRICLGGVRDEAEIRGHRRTYVGAMPGRLATGLKEAGVSNPVMLLDEIDKVGSDVKGDPASALLEVLDPEQNSHFSDHYVEIPINLSNVLFICTANSLDTIPRPLLDRMEIIEVSGYTENEKYHIAKDHLWEKQKKANGLKKNQVTITKKALQQVILNYTRESGVRGLERKIAQICRKAAMNIVENNEKQVRVSGKNLESILGKPVYEQNMANEKPMVGIVRGLAWTSVGGETLEIEVSVLPGSGNILLTGKLGDVMKESAQIALTYVKSVVGDKLDQEFYSKHDIHLHVPEGAVPKDGPSAGVTMATAMYSALLDMPVRPDVAMTGEITLRGRVLPIGGLKEKLLAAKAAGIKMVMVPDKNKKDVDELDAEIVQDMELHFVRTAEDIWNIIF